MSRKSKKSKQPEVIIPRSEGAKQALLRGGAGPHDSRPRDQRSRRGERSAAIRDSFRNAA